MDPFSGRRVNVRDAGAAITEYRRSTGDLAGMIDLMLTFVEAGTEQAVDWATVTTTISPRSRTSSTPS